MAGRYRLVRRAGVGGMGVVWEAHDERLDRPVAVKQLRHPPDLDPAEAQLVQQRALEEARITARLQHPYAVAVYDVVEHEGRPCLVMQYLPSESLATVLRGLGTLLPEEAARVGAQVGSALAAAHRLGIVHRDVKPGNVLVDDDGTARISDFGIADAPGDVPTPGSAPGHVTPAYLAPEVARGGGSGFAADVYALGATLYAAVEGTPPFGTDEDPGRLLRTVATAELAPPQRAGVLTPVLLRMLAADPADRPSMAEAAEQLAALAPARGSVSWTPGPAPRVVETRAAPPPTRTSSTGSGRRGRRVPAVLAAVLAVLLGLGVLFGAVAGNDASDVAGRGPAPAPTTAVATPPTTPTASAGAPGGGPVYASTIFAVPFESDVPTWVAPTPEVAGTHLVTWVAADVAVRFLVPVAVHPPGAERAADPPQDYLAYLRAHADDGVRVSDVTRRSVGGRPATLLTATAVRRLAGSIGCPDPDLSATKCHGLRPERRLRLAVVDVDGREVLIWLRNDREPDFAEQTEQFETLLDSVRFR